MNTHNKNLKVKTLLLAIGVCSAAMSHAKEANPEIEQLRNEINELRQLLNQQTQQQQQQAVQLQNYQTEKVQLSNKDNAVQRSGLTLTKGGAEMTFYGNVRADLQYQIEGGPASRIYNQISTVALDGVSENSDNLKSTLSATRLGFDFKTPTTAGDVGGKVEVDFLGGSSLDTLRIRHAYLTYGNWLIGQTWSNFAPPDFMPESIDALGFVGGAVKRTPQVRYTQKLNADTNFVYALEDSKDASSDMRLPALTARANHKFSDSLLLSARGMVTEKRTKADEEAAWGVGVGVKYDVTPKTSIKADYYHVNGDSSFVSWTNQGFVTDANNQILETNEFDSITVGITQQFNEKLRGTLGYGYMKADNNDRYVNALADKTKANKDLWQAWGNVFYSPVKPISLGVEYVFGEREAFGAAPNGSKTGEDNRVNAVAIYNF
ncbi:DcaP family trimeric outer membrane transporter [Acinetobacter defluvii]|uniref:DcaP family trimeric outer membrane transporter n=1 Tax=Acinetobacter defluvii TaxID=1871111 RepID=UPI003AF5FE59